MNIVKQIIANNKSPSYTLKHMTSLLFIFISLFLLPLTTYAGNRVESVTDLNEIFQACGSDVIYFPNYNDSYSYRLRRNGSNGATLEETVPSSTITNPLKTYTYNSSLPRITAYLSYWAASDDYCTYYKIGEDDVYYYNYSYPHTLNINKPTELEGTAANFRGRSVSIYPLGNGDLRNSSTIFSANDDDDEWEMNPDVLTAGAYYVAISEIWVYDEVDYIVSFFKVITTDPPKFNSIPTFNNYTEGNSFYTVTYDVSTSCPENHLFNLRAYYINDDGSLTHDFSRDLDNSSNPNHSTGTLRLYHNGKYKFIVQDTTGATSECYAEFHVMDKEKPSPPTGYDVKLNTNHPGEVYLRFKGATDDIGVDYYSIGGYTHAEGEFTSVSFTPSKWRDEVVYTKDINGKYSDNSTIHSNLADVTIQSISNPASVTCFKGTPLSSISFPTTTTITTNYGDLTVSIASWDKSNYNSTGTTTFYGTLKSYDGLINPNNLKVAYTVNATLNPPNVTCTVNNADNWTTSKTVQLGLNKQDAGGLTTCKIWTPNTNGSIIKTFTLNNNSTASLSHTITQNGTYMVEVITADNQHGYATFTINTIDTIVPSKPTQGNIVINPNDLSTFNISWSDALDNESGISHYIVTTNNTNSRNVNSTSTIVSASEISSVKIYAVDKAGNTSAEFVLSSKHIDFVNLVTSSIEVHLPKHVSWDYATTQLPATTTIVTEYGNMTTSVNWSSVNFNSDSLTNTLTGTLNVPTGFQNSKDITITANIVYHDYPTVSLSYPKKDTLWVTGTQDLLANITTDNLSLKNVKVYKDDNFVTSYQPQGQSQISLLHSILDNGTYKFVVEDTLGQLAETSLTVTNIDNNSPTPITSLTSSLNPTNPNKINITWTEATDTQSGVKHYEIKTSTRTFTVSETSVSLDISELDTLSITTIDNVGLLSPAYDVYTPSNKFSIVVTKIYPLADIIGTRYSSINNFQLPTSVQVDTNIGTTTLEISSWNTLSYKSIDRYNIVYGNLSLPEHYSNPSNLQAIQDIILSEKAMIQGFCQTPTVYPTYGQSLSDINIPTVRDVTLDTGAVFTLPVTYYTNDYDSTNTNLQTFKGTVDLTGYEILTGEIEALLDVRVTSPNAINTEILAPMTVPSTFDWTYESMCNLLPSSFNVTYINPKTDKTYEVNTSITWEQDYTTLKETGQQIIIGELNLPEGYTNSNNLIASILVSTPTVTSVPAIATIEVPAFTLYEDLNLPTELNVTFTDMRTDDIIVSTCQLDWSYYNNPYSNIMIDNVQILKAKLILPKGYLNLNNLDAYISVIVHKTHTKDVMSPTEIIVEYGTPLDNITLPTEIHASNTTNSEEVLIPISYDIITYNPTELGTKEYTGIITTENPYVDFSGITIPNLKITVCKTTATEIIGDKIVYTGKLGQMLDEIIPTYPTLPTVDLTLSSGVGYRILPNWDLSTFDYTLHEQVLTGELELPEGIKNTSNLQGEMYIQLEPNIDNWNMLIKMPDLPTIKIAKGSDVSNVPFQYRLPVMYADGVTRDIDVSYWDSSNIDTETIGVYYATATLLPSDWKNTLGLQAIQKVEVIDLNSSSNQIKELLPIPPIEIISGEQPNIPTECLALTTSNEVISVPVKFDDSNIGDLKNPGVYYLDGTVSGNNPLNIKPILEIDVIDLFAEDLYITQIKDPALIRMPLGTEFKKLPITKSVKARLSDNRWIYLSPTFDTSLYNPTTASLQAFKAISMAVDTGYTNKYNLTTTSRVKLFELDSDLSTSLTITKVFNPTDMSVIYATEYGNIVTPNPYVQLSNGITTPVKSPWVLGNYDKYLVDVQVFKAPPRAFYNPNDLEAILNIRVLPDRNDVTGEKTIIKKTLPNVIYKQKGKLLDYNNLPKTILCTLRNKSTIELPVVWEYTNQIVKMDMTITGTIQLPEYMYTIIPLDVTQYIDCTNSFEENESKSDNSDVKSKDNDVLETPIKPVITETNLYPLEEALLNSTSIYVPYTLPYSKIINWHDVIRGSEGVTITPKIFNDEAIVDVSLATKHCKGSQKTMIIKPEYNSNPTFTDIQPSHWAYKSLIDLSTRGYVKGTKYSEFEPKAPIGIADTFTFLDRILVTNFKLRTVNDRTYVDSILTDKEHWAYYTTAGVLSKLSKSAINDLKIANTTDIYNRQLTREEVAVILYHILSMYAIEDNLEVNLKFNDLYEVHHLKEVSYCVQLGLFYGDTKGNFNPHKNITRAELISVLLRLDDLIKNPQGKIQ